MALKVGDKLPSFTAIDTNGAVFDSQTIVGKQPLVIYFYPKDETKVCTDQACSFRDRYQDFQDLGATVIGVSSDSVQSHQKFTKKHHLPFLLLADEAKKLQQLFGVKKDLFGLIPGRVTYVADKNGIVQMVFSSMSSQIHITKALALLKKNI